MAWQNDPMTPRQAVAITFIEEYLGLTYANGDTKGAAGAFIGEYYEQAKRVRDGQSTQVMTNRQAIASLKQKKLLDEMSPWD